MDFAKLMQGLADAAAKGDGRAAAALFTEDGVYHDVFYGAFEGRGRIAEMIEDYFHRDAKNFRWDMHDAVSTGDLGYARYVFSYESKLPEAEGKRVLFEGVSIVRLKDGLIQDYREVANAAVGLHTLGFAPERVAKFLGREASELAGRAESAGHLKS